MEVAEAEAEGVEEVEDAEEAVDVEVVGVKRCDDLRYDTTCFLFSSLLPLPFFLSRVLH